MESGKDRLMTAARSLLAEHPQREPSTRELYEAAGVAAPTLYHHFGDKDGLLQAVVVEAFATYLELKRSMPRTDDLLTDFAAGWDMHVSFGVENPVLYALMYARTPGRQNHAAQTAERELRGGLERLAHAGLLQMSVDEAAALTTAMAVGCVTQLIRSGGSPSGPLARSMRMTLLSALTGHAPVPGDADQAARVLLTRLGALPGRFTGPEEALLRQWLNALTEHSADPQEADPQEADPQEVGRE
jgi:AcrR family transcriptional regulator